VFNIWKAKLAVWTHDPLERAFSLLRASKSAQQHGSLAVLRAKLDVAEADFDHSSNLIAAGADYPNWPEPNDASLKPSWASPRFAENPVLIHPLTGDELKLQPLDELDLQVLEAAGLQHFDSLLEPTSEGIDYRLTQLAFWRFGSEPKLIAPELGATWQRLPVDSRSPDQSVWAHLDLASAIAGAKLGGEPALLTMSFGPVQGFIAQARSVSDLWAGSHLLSSLVWAGLQVLCEELGPDAVIQPNLRGIAAVDRWILESAPESRQAVWRERFSKIGAEWLAKSTDENPLFSATMPNKFTAIVPAESAKGLADRIEARIRKSAVDWAQEAAQTLFGSRSNSGEYWQKQIEEQLAGFPDVSWSIVYWPLPQNAGGSGLPEDTKIQSLKSALQAFYPAGTAEPGLFGPSAWHVLNQEVKVGDTKFYQPSPGILYPAIHDLAERSLAAAKSCRPFTQLVQRGYRCTLCGEREWLTNDPQKLEGPPPGKRKKQTLWADKAGSNGIKEGEHLCALCTLKRLWPNLFRDQLKYLLDADDVPRFVVSTHTMAIATSLDKALNEIRRSPEDSAARLDALDKLASHVKALDSVALPKQLAAKVRELENATRQATTRRIPSLLDSLRESESLDDDEEPGEAARLVREFLDERPETYYALLKMDGDRMGAWIAGGDESLGIRYEQSWSKAIRENVNGYKSRSPSFKQYVESLRVNSPSRHSAISSALNDFSANIVRHVIEECFKGKLIYSGGDDVLAMLSVDDLLPALVLLRAAYSGVPTASATQTLCKGLSLVNGYAWVKDRPFTMMGAKATASVGAIVAHNQAPLAAVLRDLDDAERQAKRHSPGGEDRNSFHITVQKRAGAEIGITGKFQIEKNRLGSASIEALITLRDLLRRPGVSRRAVFHSVEWLRALPVPAKLPEWKGVMIASLGYQLHRQSAEENLQRSEADGIAEKLVGAAITDSIEPKSGQHARPANKVLEDLLVTAEFFARESRSPGAEATL